MVLLSFTWFCRFFLGLLILNGFDLVNDGFTGFYLVFSGLIRPYRVVLGFEITTGFFCIV